MSVKSALAAAAVALVAGAASAQSITFTPAGSVTFDQLFNPDGGVFSAGQFTSGQLGTFTAAGDGSFSLTYLGQESAFSDSVHIQVNGQALTESNQVGDRILGPMVDGTALDFMFRGSAGSFAVNGGPAALRGSFVLLGSAMQTSQGTFDYVLGYNDSFRHDDWDDIVVGLNAVAPVPEPQTYALMLAGLGAVGFLARRRRPR